MALFAARLWLGGGRHTDVQVEGRPPLEQAPLEARGLAVVSFLGGISACVGMAH